MCLQPAVQKTAAMRACAWALLCILLAPLAGLAALPATSAPGGTAALAMFVGNWQSHGSFTAPGVKKVTHVSGRTRCQWSGDAHLFLICNGVAQVEGMATSQHQLSVYLWDAASGQYRFVGITPDRPVVSPTLSFQANTWYYSSSFTGKDNKTHWYRTLNIFDSPDRYRFEIQSSEDGKHWITTGSGVSIRK